MDLNQHHRIFWLHFLVFIVFCAFVNSALHIQKYAGNVAQPLAKTETTKRITIDKWSVTKINVKKIRYAWTILNYNLHGKKGGEYLESPTFSIDNEYKWRLQWYPRPNYNSYDGYSRSSSNNEYVSLYLTLLSGDSSNVPITYNFGLMTTDEDIYFPQDARVANVAYGGKEGYQNFMDKNELQNYLNEDKLTIIAEIAINVGYTNISGACSSSGPDTSNYDHTDNFENLLDDEIFSDAQIKIGQYEFKVHRAILASVSSVFKAEFTELQSAGLTVLNISDVEPKVFKEVLRFAYTGKVEKLDKLAKELLPIAKRFDIEQLERLCEQSLCQNLNADNAMDLLSLATSNNATYLKVQALKFITTHAESMVDTPTFASLISQPQNLINVIRSLINNSTA